MIAFTIVSDKEVVSVISIEVKANDAEGIVVSLRNPRFSSYIRKRSVSVVLVESIRFAAIGIRRAVIDVTGLVRARLQGFLCHVGRNVEVEKSVVIDIAKDC